MATPQMAMKRTLSANGRSATGRVSFQKIPPVLDIPNLI